MHTTTLAQRLRAETIDSHRLAEDAAGLPATVSSTNDYARLLARLLGLHAGLETVLSASRWQADWIRVGIVPADHTRSHLLEDDLWTLESSIPDLRPVDFSDSFASFGEVLGLLYVVEGSALGGVSLAPMIRSTLGTVPTRFYDSDGRDHPRPWRSLQAALRVYDESDDDPAAVLEGARRAFALFTRHLESPLWSSVR